MKYKELTTQPEAEVKKMLEELKGKAHDLAVKIRLNQVKNGHEIASLRKDIARVKTFLNKASGK